MKKARSEILEARASRARARGVAEVRALRAIQRYERARAAEEETLARHERELRDVRDEYAAACVEVQESGRALNAYGEIDG